MSILKLNFNRLNPYRNFLVRLSLFFVACLIFRYLHLFINKQFYQFEIPLIQKINNPIGEFLIYALVLLFAFAMRGRIAEFKEYKYKGGRLFPVIFLLLSIAAIAFPMSFFESRHISSTLYYFGPLYLSYIFLFVAIFGKNFVLKFESEHILMTVIIYIYLWFSLAVLQYWKTFAYIILQSLKLILSVFTTSAAVNAQNLNVSVGDFNVFVGAPCAGFYSLLLFVIFFILSVFLNRKKGIRYLRAAIIFVLGFAGLFFLNILRIAIILLVGAYYSQALAINIFHEYLGSLLFILFMYLYLWVAMPLIIRNRKKRLM